MTVPNVSGGNPIDPVWGNAVANDVNFLLGRDGTLENQGIRRFANAAARNAAVTSPVEGQVTALQDVDRTEIWNGSAWVRFGSYSAGGRTGVSASVNNISIGPGLTVSIPFLVFTDPEGFYTGWDGTAHAFTVPAGLGGVYAITANVFSTVSLTAGGMSVSIASGGLTYPCSTNPPTTWGSASVPSLPLAAGGKFSVNVRNEHSASSNFNVVMFAYRVMI